MAGEVTRNSVILQSRMTTGERTTDGDVPGKVGYACFEVASQARFRNSFRTKWMAATSENDFIIKTKVAGLDEGTRYYYRLLSGEDTTRFQIGERREFRTWPAPDVRREASFVVVTGMCFGKFHFGVDTTGKRAYQGSDKHLGYPGLKTILGMKPDFFVGTGDNVYYDFPVADRATTQAELRKKWHEQFVQPRYVELFAQVPSYWEKDDHDHRYNDCDTTGQRPPSNELGIETFREQVPVVDSLDPHAVTYRTHQINGLLQIWLVEGRDYRSPNDMPDGPGKTLWGREQKAWLKQTLSESDAVFKILISPTPLVGPDGTFKNDNHTNFGGFRHEGNEFFAWLKENDFMSRNFFIICGDRHWQYHSEHPFGIEEFSCGALVDANSRFGFQPGDSSSTDPGALITQPYLQEDKSGGFLAVSVTPGKGAEQDKITFAFYDEFGVQLYMTTKTATSRVAL
ncbi:MAG: alkaline phosphatase D family protein [Fidelibacterota bacterium]|nr:MAG: alkaline phosphatase D family protein [Candidatus Neomarinimicrobiota bacterium]